MTHVCKGPFSPKDPREIIIVAFDFAPLTSAPTSPVFTVARFNGAADPTPATMISGEATIVGTEARQRLIGGVAGCTYIITAQVDTADGLRFVEADKLSVELAA